MKERCHGFYATRIYLPLSSVSRRLRKFSRRMRGKQGRGLQATRLPEVRWADCVKVSVPRVWVHKKENGNVRISELAILSAFAASGREGSSLFEIGTFDGRTTLNLALNAPATCRIYTLDLPPDLATKYQLADGERHMVEKLAPGSRYEKYRSKHSAAISRIHQLIGDSATFDYSRYKGLCSLVFVDGSHAYDYVLSDTRAAMSIVEPGGIVVWHDYGIWEGVTNALDELEQRERFGLRNIRGTSLVIWKKK
jgi:predicted O-methyltransferase YrrM